MTPRSPRAAEVIQNALGIESGDVVNYCFPKDWPEDTCRVSSASGHSQPQTMPPPFLPPFPPPLRPPMPEPPKAQPPKPKPPKPKPPKSEPAIEARARIIGDRLQTEARYLA